MFTEFNACHLYKFSRNCVCDHCNKVKKYHILERELHQIRNAFYDKYQTFFKILTPSIRQHYNRGQESSLLLPSDKLKSQQETNIKYEQ
jgi:hypothetical protein